MSAVCYNLSYGFMPGITDLGEIQMFIDVINFGPALPKEKIYGKNAVVIDVLRCTSCIAAAFSNGAERVAVFERVEDASAYANLLGRGNTVLGGERRGLPISGFDVGNSPLEYTEERVRGRTCVMSTSNGAKCLTGICGASDIFTSALINHHAVFSALSGMAEDLTVICSGTAGNTSADDVIAAGALVSDFYIHVSGCEFSDSALIAMNLYDAWKRGQFDLSATKHCKYLMSLGEGYRNDVLYCMTENTCRAVPLCSGPTEDGRGIILINSR